ncbi:UNVERIFIED_CONTAM: hypothetical protein Slati_2121200 [Sesamum latifolium]|uniref:Reverse transcriptase domain-containing protein n=1 Tax=Sesamum latifolium TaxID=2727402 RepID=A0AAW2WV69_9LAMI
MTRKFTVVLKHILGASSPPVDSSRAEDIARGIAQMGRVVDSNMADDLMQPYTEAEVTKALFRMASLKSPGPDGRLTTDNILLAFEINHFLNTKAKGGQEFMMLKLDVSKAYDKVEWTFLEQVMLKLGFPSPFVRLAILCMSFASYSFLLGGKQFGSVILEGCLHQEGPSLPYLFLLCIEAFSSLLQTAELDGRIRGIAIYRGAPSVSHLLFANDTLIFSNTSRETARAILDVLDLYRHPSGQEINFAKSSIAFSKNINEED